MRLLMISDHADPLATIGSQDAGGQNIFVRYLGEHLAKLGIDVDIYTRWDKKIKKEVVQLNKHLRIIRVKAGPVGFIPRDSFVTVLPEFTHNILKRIKAERVIYDAVHTNYWFSGLAGLEIAKLLHLPHVHVNHSLGHMRYNALKSGRQATDDAFYRFRLASEKRIAESVTAFIATSTFEEQLAKTFFSLPAYKIVPISGGVDNSVFHSVPMRQARQRLGWNQERKAIVYVGRFEWRKGLETLIQALPQVLKKHPNADLYIVGGSRSRAGQKLDAEERGRLETIASSLGIKHHLNWVGPKEQAELKYVYSAADVCVVPSYYEYFGLVPIEAMACGTPVVVSRTGGMQFTVQDGVTGHQASVQDAEDFAHKISTVLNRGKNYYSVACLSRIEALFSWKKIAEAYEGLINQLTRQPIPYFRPLVKTLATKPVKERVS